MFTDTEACYAAVKSKDRRFDGVFYTGVQTTGIYCRPSCPARTPASVNVQFFATAAAAQTAGFRACKRCLPDATPGSPDWDFAADVAGRAMRLISDGVVDRDGVEGLASRLGYTPRHLNRVLGAELGAGPLSLARARRAQTARILIETTTMTFADVAFAAGFSSVRQFNDTLRQVYASSPTELRGRRSGSTPATGELTMRLAVRTPFAGRELLEFLTVHVIAGVESAGRGWYARSLSLPHGPGTVRLELDDALDTGGICLVKAKFRLMDLRDTAAAVERVRRVLDADCDPQAIASRLIGDPVLATQVRAAPGLRVPGTVDGDEIAVRAVLGQQVSVARACNLAAGLADEHGVALPVDLATDGLSALFPSSEALADLDPAKLPMPRARGRALTELCAALASGEISLDRGADRGDVRRDLLAVPGIGPWTADYIAMRALADPDVFLPGDVGVRNALTALGVGPAETVELSETWRPWRSYALMYLWRSLWHPEEKN